MRTCNHSAECGVQLMRTKAASLQAVVLEATLAYGQFATMITSSSAGVERKAWSDINKYDTVSVCVPKNSVFINEGWCRPLNESTRKRLVGLTKRVEERSWERSEDGDRDYQANLTASTVNVSALDYVIRQYIARINETLVRDRRKQAKSVGLQALLKFTNQHLMRSSSSGAITPAR